MRRLPITSLAILPLVLTASASAQRFVSVTFVNQTQTARLLQVTTPAGTETVGSFTKNGVFNVVIPVFDDRTPITVYWRARDQEGEFTIDGDTFGYLRIDLTSRGPVGPYATTTPAPPPRRGIRN